MIDEKGGKEGGGKKGRKKKTGEKFGWVDERKVTY